MSDDANRARLIRELETLQRDFERALPERLRAVGDGCRAAGTNSNEQLETLRREVHTLAGSAATFGFPDVSAVARRLEIALAGGHHDPSRIAELTEALEDAGRRGVHGPQSAVPSSRVRAAGDQAPLIDIVEDDEPLARSLELQIGLFGYEVRTFPDSDAFRASLCEMEPAAVVMDMVFPGGDLLGAEAMLEVQNGRERRLPVVFISRRSDLHARLSAVRAGADAYFTKPLDVGALLDKLGELTERSAPNPHRVLLVDDDPAGAAFHALVLSRAGLVTSVVTDPLQVQASLGEFRPDVVLMDLQMPDWSGAELAAALRLEEANVGLPIVFLSAETDPSRQSAALLRGGDDFLTKGLDPARLVEIVEARAKSSRRVRSHLVRDGLTGLLNHSALISQLEVEMMRADRRDETLSFAMLDVDDFKTVNDTHGHLAGDRVLRTLAQLLVRRLRRTDLVGRYGGEEFAVIVPGMSGRPAAEKLDSIRESFRALRHTSPGGAGFGVSFSVGVATAPPAIEPSELVEAADRALYRAKAEGKNRVVRD